MDKTRILYWSYIKERIEARARQIPEFCPGHEDSRCKGICTLINGRIYDPDCFRVKCAGGEQTNVYLDLKGLFTSGEIMLRVAYAISNYCFELGFSMGGNGINTVGGPTMGADFLSHALAITDPVSWFSVRDEPKDHGLQRLIEGRRLGKGHNVLLVDDVVSTGKSLLKAFDAVADTGADIVAVMPIVHRGRHNWETFSGVPYWPLFTSEELGMEPL